MPNTKFITNQEKLLTEVISNILPSCQNLYFLVGYFYFSGYLQLHEHLKDKHLRVLVGMDVERNMFNKIKEFEIIQEVNLPRGQIKQNYEQSLVQLFNDTDYFDTKAKEEAFQFFLEKMRNGTLEIRKTHQPNHAKLYLFENVESHSQGGLFPGTVITGSSNFSYEGLRGRYEVNVMMRDHFEEAKALFDDLWDKAIDIVGRHNAAEFEANVVQKIWIEKLPKPFLMYIRVLDEYFAVAKSRIRLPAEITKNRFFNLEYQTDAIHAALKIIEQHNGVIISDVVGLGKSIIASAIAHNLNLKTVVIAPPHLKDQWEDYRTQYDFNARIFSTGAIEKALEYYHEDQDEKLIIVDEAHKFRNEQTQDYGNLHKLCQGNKIVLLTATPFNNRPQDIFAMIKLFQIPAKSTIQTVDNLAIQFRELILEYKQITKAQKEKTESPKVIKQRIQKLAQEIRDLIAPLLIRRSRLDLRDIDKYHDDLQKQNIQLNMVEPPKLLEYDLGHLSGLYINTLEKISSDDDDKNDGFLGARYKPTSYLKNLETYKAKLKDEYGDENLFIQSQVNLAKFMRRLLVRRFESSKYSFRASLESMIKSSQLVLDWALQFNKVPIYKKGQLPAVESILEDGGVEADTDPNELDLDNLLATFKEKGLLLIDLKDLKEDFLTDLQNDIALLQSIHDEWFQQGLGYDPKVEHLKLYLSDWLAKEPHRKIVIFTEFSDTAHYLKESLKDRFRVFKYSSADATQANKDKIRKNFDAGLPESLQQNDYDILIATDAISEGFNLHRAGIIFNYDIPYNPTRVIQRVGRINRINKKVFDNLYIYNYFPTATGEEETRVKQITTLKIDMIHALLGEDTQVLTDEEELESFFQRQIEQLQMAEEERSWDVDYLNLLNRLKTKQPELIQQARELPRRSRVRRSVPKGHKGVLIFARKGQDYKFKLGADDQDVAVNPHTAIQLFEAEISEQPQKISESFDPIYQRLKSTLFERKTQISSDKGRREAMAVISALSNTTKRYKDYCRDLLIVMRTLDSLTEYHLKLIRGLDLNQPDDALAELQKELPYSYLNIMLEMARKIEEGEEAVILSEELI